MAEPLVMHADPEIGVVWPLGPSRRRGISFVERLGDLDGKRIAEVWSWMWKGEEAFSILRETLIARYPDITLVPYTEFGNIHGPDESKVVADLPDRLRAHGIDGVILGIANCGSCTPAVLRAHLACERAGFPAVSIVSERYVAQATAIAEHLGVSGAALAVYPGYMEADDDATFRGRYSTAVKEQIVGGLTGGTIGATTQSRDPAPRDIVFRGTTDAVAAHFEAQQWTDGLPIVPPTLERVEAFLACTPRDPEEVLGVLLPSDRQATVWNVAVNGVMAGCRPEDMPLLVAAVEVLCDPKFRLEDQGAAPGWEMMAIVSGPIATRLGFNHAHGVCSTGYRANTCMGRFLRLYSRNVAGHRLAAATDYAAIGQSFFVAIAEDEDLVREIGWPTFGEDRGLAPGEDGVTVRGVVAASPSFLYAGADNGDVAAYLAPMKDVFGDAMCGYWGFTGATYGEWHPLLILNPQLARLIARAGWTKDMIRQHLYDNCRTTARRLESLSSLMNVNLADQVRDGVLPQAYHESDNPDRLVPIFVRAEWISIVVAGSPTTFSRGYMNNHEQGIPLTRRLSLVAQENAPALSQADQGR